VIEKRAPISASFAIVMEEWDSARMSGLVLRSERLF
jgi:hypothetical protein